jgi:hypothetical protein
VSLGHVVPHRYQAVVALLPGGELLPGQPVDNACPESAVMVHQGAVEVEQHDCRDWHATEDTAGSGR